MVVDSQTPMVSFPTIPKSPEKITRTTAISTLAASTDAAIRRIVLEKLKLKKKIPTTAATTPRSLVQPQTEKRRLISKSFHQHSSLDADKSLDDFCCCNLSCFCFDLSEPLFVKSDC